MASVKAEEGYWSSFTLTTLAALPCRLMGLGCAPPCPPSLPPIIIPISACIEGEMGPISGIPLMKSREMTSVTFALNMSSSNSLLASIPVASALADCLQWRHNIDQGVNKRIEECEMENSWLDEELDKCASKTSVIANKTKDLELALSTANSIINITNTNILKLEMELNLAKLEQNKTAEKIHAISSELDSTSTELRATQLELSDLKIKHKNDIETHNQKEKELSEEIATLRAEKEAITKENEALEAKRKYGLSMIIKSIWIISATLVVLIIYVVYLYAKEYLRDYLRDYLSIYLKRHRVGVLCRCERCKLDERAARPCTVKIEMLDDDSDEYDLETKDDKGSKKNKHFDLMTDRWENSKVKRLEAPSLLETPLSAPHSIFSHRTDISSSNLNHNFNNGTMMDEVENDHEEGMARWRNHIL